MAISKVSGLKRTTETISHRESGLQFGDGMNGRVPSHTPEWSDPNDTDPGTSARDYGAGVDAFVFAPMSAAQTDLDNGRLVCEVGVAVSRPKDSHDRFASIETGHLLEDAEGPSAAFDLG